MLGVAVAAMLALSGCRFLTEAGSLLSGVEAPADSLWLQQGDAFVPLANGQVVETASGKLKVRLKPYPARQKNTVEMYIEVAGRPAEGATVIILYEMFGMDHIYAPALAASQGSGWYSARLELPMKGLWELRASVERPGGGDPQTYVLRLRNDADLGGLGGHAH